MKNIEVPGMLLIGAFRAGRVRSSGGILDGIGENAAGKSG